MSGQMTTAASSGTLITTTDHSSGSGVGPEDDFLFVLLLLVGVFILVVNALTVAAIVTTPDLNTQANGYIFHLAVADGIVGVCALWWAFRYVDATRAAFEELQSVCISGYMLTTVSASQSLLTLALMAFDRLVFVERPYLYARRFTETLTRRILAGSWVVSVAYGTLVSLLLNDFSPETGCVVYKILQGHVEKFLIPIPFSVILCFTSACYLRIACVARHHRKKINAEVGRAAHIQQPVNTLSSRSRSTSTKPASRDRFKSTGLFVTVNCIFALCWAPFVVYGSVVRVLPESDTAAGFVQFVAIANSGMNFVIYACKNRQFARAYKRLLGRCECVKQRL